MSATNLSRFEELVSRYLDERLNDTEAAELAALLAEPALATRFLEMTRLNSEIAGLLSAPVPDAAMVELVSMDIKKALAAAQPSTGVRLRIADRTQPRPGSICVSAPRAQPVRQKFAVRALAWAAVFLVFAGLAAVFLFNGAQRLTAPAVTSIQGEARLIGASGERALTAGESWRRGETIKTVGPNSAVTVTCHDGTRLDFGGNTVAINQSTKEARRVELEHGSLQGTIKKQLAHRPFTFATAEAEAIVVGTALRFLVGAHHTRLEVTEGEVRFRRRHDGAEVAVKAGNFAVVAPNVPFAARPNHTNPHHP